MVRLLESHRGRPMLVNFWATWCVPCMEELPDLIAEAPAFEAEGGLVLGIALERMVQGVTVERARTLVEKTKARLGIDFPLVVYEDENAIPLTEKLGLPGPIPVTLAIDAAGNKVLHEGLATREEFAELARTALGGR